MERRASAARRGPMADLVSQDTRVWEGPSANEVWRERAASPGPQDPGVYL